MKQPAIQTMFLGHPVVAVPLMLTGCATLAAALYGSNLFIGIIGVAVLGTAQKAYAQARAYKAWAKEWDGMALASPRAVKRGWRSWVVAGMALGWFGLLCARGESVPEAAVATLLTAGLVAMLVTVGRGALRLMRRFRRPSEQPVVVAVVARPAMPVPSLTDAYRALPPYCRVLLGGQW
jgi:hypothetical protein